MEGFKQYMQNSEADLVNLYLHSNLSITEIAEIGEISKTKVYRILEKNGVIPNRLNRYRAQIESMLQIGMPDKDIAKSVGYSQRHIRNIKKDLMQG